MADENKRETAEVSENNNGSFWVQVFGWAKQRPLTDLLLCSILVSIGWMGHYSITVAIPAHLNQIQTGYRELTTEIHERHQQERAETIKTYDRWIEYFRDGNTGRKNNPIGDASPSMLAVPDNR